MSAHYRAGRPRSNATGGVRRRRFTVIESKHERRPDIVLFVNGPPLAVIGLKNPADENATVRTAFRQLQTYKAEVPSLFTFNAALIVSDGLATRIGTLTAGWEWFKSWRTIAGETLADSTLPQLRVLLEGVFNRRRLLALLRDFIVFEDDGGGGLVKKMADYHQFHAVRIAVAETLRAAALQQAVADRDPQGRYESGRQPGGAPGDRRIGVVWHTRGSGKSLTMAFCAGCVMRSLAMENPTVVVLTDRNDLDDQLFTTSRAAPTCCASRPRDSRPSDDIGRRHRRSARASPRGSGCSSVGSRSTEPQCRRPLTLRAHPSSDTLRP